MKTDFIITDQNVDKRLDVFVQSQFPSYTRSHIKILNEQGNILLNGKNYKCGEKLKLGDRISVNIPEKPLPLEIKAECIPLDIIYQDNDMVIVNKKQGMVVHPACGNYTGTLVNALLFNIDNLSGINGVMRPGIVHRLDKDTSGLLVVAKNDKAHNNLAHQIQVKSCHRYYKGIVEGVMKDDSGVITTHIDRSKKDRKKMCVCPDNEGKLAITEYKVLERFRGYTYVEFKLQTGRTHQIRVHSKFLGHPIVGDETYGYKDRNFKLNGQLLHAYKLELTQPTTNEKMTFLAPLPDYFEKVLNILREKNSY
jgi:23S rRNA pseudouridine1911/1915/1917 synthase